MGPQDTVKPMNICMKCQIHFLPLPSLDGVQPLTPELCHGPWSRSLAFPWRSLAKEALKYFRGPHLTFGHTHNTTSIILPLDDSGCSANPHTAVGWYPAIGRLRPSKYNDHLQRWACLDGSPLRTPAVDDEQWRYICPSSSRKAPWPSVL